MVDGKIEAKFEMIVAAVAEHLKPLGFSKRSHGFHRLLNGNVALIEFQRSVANDHGLLRFTMNVGVVSGRLASKEAIDIKRVGSSGAHLRKRLGEFLPQRFDKWWELNASEPANAAIWEILELLRSHVIPFLDQHISDDALIALWETGRSPGLTEKQRTRYLDELRLGV